MGSAILKGLIETGTLPAGQALVFDTDAEKTRQAAALGACLADSAQQLAAQSDILLLATKPQDMAPALQSIKNALAPEALVISIAAGISIGYLKEMLGSEIRTVRVMPNTPALVRKGAAGIALSADCTDADARIAEAIFGAIGIAERVPEDAMDAVTALSGSGPAYFFYLVECLVKAAVELGLPEDQAARLAGQTFQGAAQLLQDSGETAATLRERVTSKGGTTAAALEQFREKGLEDVIRAGLQAAAQRSKELGQ